jgi:type I restriction enzyme, S subunit
LHYFIRLCFASEDYEEEGIKLLRIGDILKNGTIDYGNMNCLPLEYAGKYERFALQDKDIVIAMTGATIGKTGFIEKKDNDNTLLNQRVGLLRCKENINQKFIYYLTKTSFFQKQVLINSMGKSQPNISPFDIIKIKMPKISVEKQNEIVEKVYPIEQSIRSLQTQIQQSLSIINDTFSDFYQYERSVWKDFGKGMTAGTQKSNERTFKYYKVPMQSLGKSSIQRFSSRFHNPLTVQLEDILEKNGTIKIKNILIEITKGIQPKYMEEGDIPVTKITNLKNGYIDFSEPEYVSQVFFDNLLEKVKLKYGDVIICCTGKISLGKVDFYDLEQESVLTVDNYILRVDEERYNPLFLTYFLRSILGAFQIEREYTGATNQIHLYANEILNFKIPNISLDIQTEIVAKIKQQLDAQKEIERAIEGKQAEISQLIMEAIQ